VLHDYAPFSLSSIDLALNLTGARESGFRYEQSVRARPASVPPYKLHAVGLLLTFLTSGAYAMFMTIIRLPIDTNPALLDVDI
jgi:hypothetical protein